MDTAQDTRQDAQDAVDWVDVRLGQRCTYRASRDITELIETQSGASWKKAVASALKNERGCLESEGFVVDSVTHDYEDSGDGVLAVIACRYDGAFAEAMRKLDECGYHYPNTIEISQGG